MAALSSTDYLPNERNKNLQVLNMSVPCSLKQFVDNHDVVKDIDILIAYARNGNLLSRYSSLIADNADLFKYWIINHQMFYVNRHIHLILIPNLKWEIIIMHAIMQLEAGVQIDEEPVIPYFDDDIIIYDKLPTFAQLLDSKPHIYRYYSNFLHIILRHAQPDHHKNRYYVSYYIYEMDPILANTNERFNTYIGTKHSNWLIYNYMLENYVPTPWETQLEFGLIFSNFNMVIDNQQLLTQLEHDIWQRNWFNIGCYFIYMSYYYFRYINQRIDYDDYMKYILLQYNHFADISDYAITNHLIRLNWLLQRNGSAKTYQYINEIEDTNGIAIEATDSNILEYTYRNALVEIDHASRGYVLLSSRRPFLMQMIAENGMNIGYNYLVMLEKHFTFLHKPSSEKYMPRDELGPNYTIGLLAILLRTGLPYALLYSLSWDQLLGVLYTRTFPKTSIYNNILYKHYEKFMITSVLPPPPQFSIYIYYLILYESKQLTRRTILNVLATNIYAYYTIKIQRKTIQIYAERNILRALVESFKSYYLPLNNKELMRNLFGTRLQQLIPRLKSYTNISYEDLTLSNQQLADKYHIKNIYSRERLIWLIQHIKYAEKSRIVYYRRSHHVTGDHKLWDSSNNTEISDLSLISLNREYFFDDDNIISIIDVTNVMSLIDATNAIQDPTQFDELTDYNFKVVN